MDTTIGDLVGLVWNHPAAERRRARDRAHAARSTSIRFARLDVADMLRDAGFLTGRILPRVKEPEFDNALVAKATNVLAVARDRLGDVPARLEERR